MIFGAPKLKISRGEIVKKQYKYVGDKYVGATPIKDGTLKMIVNPGDIIEVDTTKCTIKNITTGIEGKQRNKDMIQGNEKLGVQPLLERLDTGLHYEAIEEETQAKATTKTTNKKKEAN